MWNENENGGRVSDDRNFNGVLQDKSTLSGARFAHSDSGMWDVKNRKSHFDNIKMW